MLIPIGDDLKKEGLPLIGLAIIAANLLAGAYEWRLWQEGMPKSAAHTSFWSEDDWAEPVPSRPVISQPWMDFIKTWGLTPFDDNGKPTVKLLTHMFLHGDIFHLLGNLLTLWVFLPSLEAAFGKLRFAILYFLAGVAGGCVHCAAAPDSTLPMIGASGAISGMVGAYFVLFGGLARIKLAWNGGVITGWKWVNFSVPAGLYVFFWMVLPQVAAAELAVATGEHMGVAWFAHAGGFFMGIIFTVIQRGDVMQNLHYSREGEITIGTTEETRLEERQQFALADTVEVDDAGELQCQYCRTPLSAGHEMSTGLVRCGNPTCGMLNILGQSTVSTKNSGIRAGVFAGR